MNLSTPEQPAAEPPAAEPPAAEPPAAEPPVVLHEMPLPAEASSPVHPLEVAYHALRGEFDAETYGHQDFRESLASFHASNVPSQYRRTRRWVALPEGVDPDSATPAVALGSALLSMPLADNTHSAEGICFVRQEHRRRGIGRTLVRAMADELAAQGRTTMTVWLTTRDAVDGGESVRARSGVGQVPTSPAGVQLLMSLGFELEQVEAQSTLAIPADRAAFVETARQWREDAAAVAGSDYRVVSWLGAVPAEHRAAFARLRRQMSIDIPSAGLDVVEETWTEERVADADGRTLAAGFALAYTIAVHEPTGEVAAYTLCEWPLDNPAAIWQGDTFVDSAHRGHRLGMLIKAANLLQLLESNPATARIHTWNAGENTHMLAINTAMGFIPRTMEGAWEKRRR